MVAFPIALAKSRSRVFRPNDSRPNPCRKAGDRSLTMDSSQLFSLMIFDHRSRRWSSVVSSTRVAMVHMCPEGS